MINSKHKDRLFIFIFGREEHKDWTLSLYNAINHTNYQNPDDITFNTMSETLYMGMKNDVSLLIHSEMNLYEHQSSYNPNMPVRELIYAGSLYDKYIYETDANIYGTGIIELPVPRLYVFYNGLTNSDDEVTLQLSDAFPPGIDHNTSDISVKVHMININYGRNRALLESCKPLMEYSELINNIRIYQKTMPIKEAVNKSLKDMPSDSILKPYLMANKAEVTNMCITEYDEAETMRRFRRDGYNEGHAEGHAEGLTEGRNEGQLTLAKVMSQLSSGVSADELIASGVPSDTISLAEQCIEEFKKNYQA